MSDQALAEMLAARKATLAEDAALWHRVALGQLSPDEAAEQRLAGRTVDADERAAIERDGRLFAPVPAERAEARLEALLARWGEEAANEAEDAEDARARVDERTGVVVPMQPHRTRRWVVGLAAAAASVVLTVWLVRRGPEAFEGGYAIELERVATNVMGSEPTAEVPTFLRGGRIRIRLVPEHAVEGAVGVVVFAWDRSGQPRRLEVEPRVAGSGLVEIDASVASLGLEEGEHELVIAIGRAQELPQAWEGIEEAIAEHGPNGQAGFEVVRTRVRVVERL
jgi:hypothetical protein